MVFSNNVFAANILECHQTSYPPQKFSDYYKNEDFPKGTEDEIFGQHLLNHINIAHEKLPSNFEYYIAPAFSSDNLYVILYEQDSSVSFGTANLDRKVSANYQHTQIDWHYQPTRAYYNLNRISGILTEQKYVPEWFIAGWMEKYGRKYPSELQWKYLCMPTRKKF